QRVFVDLDEVVVIRQAFPVSRKGKFPVTGPADGILEIGAESRADRSAIPAFLVGLALQSVATQKACLLLLHIAKTWHIGDVWPIPKRAAVLLAGKDAFGPASFDVVHQVVAKFAGGVGEPAGKFWRRGIEQNARRLKRRSAKKNQRCLKFERRL